MRFNKREFERAVAAKVDEALEEVGREYENAIRSMSLELKGHPVEEIKPLVRARWNDLGGEITDPKLTEIATAIMEGAKITFHRG